MNDISETAAPRDDLLRMAADIVSAYVRNNQLPAEQVQDVIRTVYSSLVEAQSGVAKPSGPPPKPAVSVRRSITPDYIICLEDGRKLKMLKRHLRTTYNMTPDEYRAKWGLPPDYPMVAPNYARRRSEFAKKIGLGQKRGAGRRGRKGAVK